MSDHGAIAWTVLVPLLGAVASYGAGRGAAQVGLLVSLGTLVAAGSVIFEVVVGGPFRHAVGGWGAPLGITLRADGIAALMLATFTVLGIAVTAHVWLILGSAPESSRTAFPLWFLTWAGLNALLLSGDVFNMYVALELTTLAAVALLGATAGRDAVAAALHYLLFAMTGSLAYLIGVVVLYGSRSTLDAALLGEALAPGPTASVAFAFMVVGLALKSALFPFHAWLPNAYASAAAPVAVVLAALVGKTAFYVLLRVWLDVFPVATREAPAQLLGALGAGGIVWGSILALRQRQLPRMLAYSSVAQIGYFFLLFPLGTEAAIEGGLYIVVSHAVAKGAMFMAAGAIHFAVGHDDIEGMKGLAHRLPLSFFALSLAGMSLIGMPPTGGFIGKWLLTRAAFEVREWWWAVVALGGGLLTASYVFRMLRGAFLPMPDGVSLRAPPRSLEWASLTLALVAVALGLVPWAPLSLLRLEGAP